MKFNDELVKVTDQGRIGRFGNNSAIYVNATQEIGNRYNEYELIIDNSLSEEFVKLSKDEFMYISGKDFQYEKYDRRITKYIVNSIRKYKGQKL